MRKIKKPANKAIRSSYYAHGGPWHNNFVLMPYITMVFTLGGFTGYYKNGSWFEV